MKDWLGWILFFVVWGIPTILIAWVALQVFAHSPLMFVALTALYIACKALDK